MLIQSVKIKDWKKKEGISYVFTEGLLWWYDEEVEILCIIFIERRSNYLDIFEFLFFFFSFLVRPGPITYWAGVHYCHLVWQCHIVSDTFNSVGKKKRIAEDYAKQFVFSIRFLLLTGSLIYAMLFISINGYNSLHSNQKPARIDISRWTIYDS